MQSSDGTVPGVVGLGPQLTPNRAVVPGARWTLADALASFKDKPLKQRFALCPWGLYSIEVMRG